MKKSAKNKKAVNDSIEIQSVIRLNKEGDVQRHVL